MGCCFYNENKFELNITHNIITHVVTDRTEKMKRAQKTNRSLNSIDDNFRASKFFFILS